MLTIGYRFGMPAKAPTYSPPSGKSNYNNPCQFLKPVESVSDENL